LRHRHGSRRRAADVKRAAELLRAAGETTVYEIGVIEKGPGHRKPSSSRSLIFLSESYTRGNLTV